MKPYNKKVINKKITQALIGVTTLGTVLAIPISIDKQDNSIGIVRENKVFAADNIKKGDTVEVGNLMPGDIFIASKMRWVVVDKNHTGYPDNSVTIMPEEFLPFKRWYDKYVENPELHSAPEFDNLGSNYWKDSDIRKYLNTTFYNKLSNDVKSSILTTRLENKACPSDGGDVYYTEDKIFLPSLTEMGLESDYCSPIGTNFQSFNTNQSRIMKSYLEDMPGYYSNEQYFTRSVSDINNYIYGVGIIDTDGRAITGYANSSNVNGDPNRSHVGIRPVLNVKPDLLVQYDGNNSLIKSTKPEFQPDKEAPTIEVIGNTTNWTNKDVVLNVSANDNNKVKSITLPDGTVVNGDKGTFTIKNNGTYKFIAEDSAGNKTTKEIVVDKIDKELPTLNLSTSIAGSTNGNVDINIDAKDTLSGVKEIKVNDTVITGNKYTVSTNGTYIVEITDNAGNKTSKQIDISKIDKELPTIAVSGNPTEWTNNNVVLNITAKDNIGVKAITLPDGKVVNSDKADFIVNENGTYKFIVEDEAGNKSIKEIVVTKIDKELPLININVKGNKMTINATDNLSGVKEVFYKVDDGEFIKYNGEVTLSQGTHTIKAKVIDNADNSNDRNGKFIIDNEDINKELPTIAVLGNPTEWTNKDIILNVSAKDNKKVKSITLPDDKVVNGDKTTFTVSKNGTYKFIVEDESGNKATKEIVVNKIDKELPIVNIDVKDDKMTIAASDKLSGIKEIFYKIDNGEFVKYTGEVTLSPGAHKIKVKAIDNAGNMNDQNSTSSEVNVNVEDKSKKDLEDATKAVEKAETTRNEDDIDRAKEKVAKLPDGKDKDDLNNRLDDLEKQIKAEKDAYIKAYNAVKKAKITLDKEDYEYAKKAVHDLNTTIYKNEKAQLQRVLDALKPYIDRKENEKKQAERNKIRNIEKLISKAIATKDTKTIEEAQAAIDELEDFDIKMALQKKLDTTNKISQMDLAIQARDAVEKLDAYLNYSDIVNNLDELKDLYKKGEKATNRLDNSGQYKNRMDKAKSYIEVIETLAKYKENAEKNNILASEKEMTELISKANQLSFTTRNKQNIIKEILKFQEQLKELRETTTVPEA
ncbi:TPA: hypothetical protein LA742_002885 [Clostridium botulinum]|uniref:DUF6273 domain-containing protein n=1 Tax=Clostridium sporogenes TaxID=1509 RepID=A0AAE6I9V0_CLOSG|nr:DUF6273 domain-containing protein [Clostridium sporogenes]AUM93738.1 hypothetical protein RSJ11_00555 [Clostridium sporogenes]QDY34568.1 hypothetical protein CGS26_19910 [Clostridium sporogenes]HBJ2614392.1 hypothetical protein [Clostridium botulinum]